MVLPDESTKLVLQLVLLTHGGAAKAFELRSASTNAPGGIEFARNKLAVVTPLSFAVSQSGVLSAVTGSVVAPLTLLTVQSPAANAAIRQTGSLYVTVTTFDATDIAVYDGAVKSAYVKVSPFDATPPLFVSVTVTAPVACAGETAVTEVLPQLVTEALVPPKETDGNAGVQTKPLPAMTTLVPPAFVPVFGVSEVIDAPAPVPPTVASW